MYNNIQILCVELEWRLTYKKYLPTIFNILTQNFGGGGLTLFVMRYTGTYSSPSQASNTLPIYQQL